MRRFATTIHDDTNSFMPLGSGGETHPGSPPARDDGGSADCELRAGLGQSHGGRARGDEEGLLHLHKQRHCTLAGHPTSTFYLQDGQVKVLHEGVELGVHGDLSHVVHTTAGVERSGACAETQASRVHGSAIIWRQRGYLSNSGSSAAIFS